MIYSTLEILCYFFTQKSNIKCYYLLFIIIFVETKRKTMILTITAIIFAYLGNHIEKELKLRKRMREYKKKLFTDDRPKYWDLKPKRN